ncbi:MAG: glucuronate isomerase [Gemmatimonadales bacterium]
MSDAGRTLFLHEDRFFDPEPEVRTFARRLYERTSALPLVCPHGHVDPKILATNEPFSEPASLLILPDHYILRMLYSQGISLESLGVPACDGTEVETNPRAIWEIFSRSYHFFRGTPTRVWLDFELAAVFGVTVQLNEYTASRIYDEISEKLASPEFRPRALFERFNIEVLATTDKATDSLQQHRAISQSDWGGRVIPTFRPDSLFAISNPGWRREIDELSRRSGRDAETYDDFIKAIEQRRKAFGSLGATATDHGVETPRAERLNDAEVRRIFDGALTGRASSDDQTRFEAHMLIEMAQMSRDDGLVMQIHAGSLRDHNTLVAQGFGPNRGGDIPVAAEFTRNLRPLLEEFGNDRDFHLILFTLDESTYTRELAPLAGHYPAVRLGPPWWFHDSIEGMRRFRESTTGTAGIYNTAGFNDDTRAFCSIPARHDLSRRMDANYLARLVATHVIDEDEAHDMAHALAYDLARTAYKLDANG